MKSFAIRLFIALCFLFSIKTSLANKKTEGIEFPVIEIIGTSVFPYDWSAGINMSTLDGITYTLTNYTLTAGEVKFRQDQSWTINWGVDSFPTGVGFQNGPNIPVAAGVYTILFNRTSGKYNFYLSDTSLTQALYTFNGNGNWSDPSNWLNNLLPPDSVSLGSVILIDPIVGGKCIVDMQKQLKNLDFLEVAPDKEIVIKLGLTIKGNEVPVKGKIVLPKGMTTNLKDYTVNSGYSNYLVSDSIYEVSAKPTTFDIQFVSDALGKEILMGFTYPGQTDFTINSTSTVLAMLLKTPAVSSLTTQGKIDFINQCKSNPLFSSTVDSLELSLKNGNSLFDTTKSGFIIQLSKLFESAANRPIKTLSQNVNILRAGKDLLFQNPGNAYVQVIGIYKNNTLVKTFTLNRYVHFVSSISEIIGAIASSPDPIQQSYTMDGDGQYEFHIRTGKPGAGIDDLESKMALQENLLNVVIDNIGAAVSFLPWIHLKQKCVKDIRSFAASQLNSYGVTSQEINSGAKMSLIVLEVSIQTLDLILTSVECSKIETQVSYLAKAKYLLSFVKQISEVSQILNSSFFLYQYFAHPAAFDTCFKVTGNTVSECGYQLQIATQYPGAHGMNPTAITLNNGNNFSTPNFVIRWVRWLRNGVPVITQATASTNGWYSHKFGDIAPTSDLNIVIQNYQVSTAADFSNFYLNVTLTNQAYSGIVGKTFTIERYDYNVAENINILSWTQHHTFNVDGTCSSTFSFSGGSPSPGIWGFIPAAYPTAQHCYDDMGNIISWTEFPIVGALSCNHMEWGPTIIKEDLSLVPVLHTSFCPPKPNDAGTRYVIE